MKKINTKQQFIAFLIFVLFVNPVYSQKALTLEDCLRLAFKSSNILKIAEFSIEAAKQKVLEKRAQKLPSVNLNSTYMRVGEITEFSIPMGPEGEKRTFKFGTPNRVNFNVTLQYPLYTWGRISSTISSSETGKLISKNEYNQKRIDLTDQTLRAFYAIALNKEVIFLHEFGVQRAKDHLEIAKDRYESGAVPKLEFLRAQVQYKNAKSSLKESEKNLEKSIIFLTKIINQKPKEVDTKEKLNYKPISISESELIDRALNVRNDLRATRLQQQLSKDQIELIESSNKPNVFLTSSYNVQNGFDPMNPNRFIDNWNMGVQLSFQIFDGFAKSHQVQQAEIQLESSQIREKELKNIIRMQVRQTYVTLQQAEEKIKTQKENIKLAKEALQVAKNQYKNGMVSSLEVIDAQRSLNQSELLHKQAIFNHIRTKLDLAKAMADYSWFVSDLNLNE